MNEPGIWIDTPLGAALDTAMLKAFAGGGTGKGGGWRTTGL